ncbi:MFS transporter [Streptomyces sp. NPDC023723]|uniref:MFS transporter n=1 Tax=Streptomyces sp. NPDC023723 TaxID=3154323 RepID=UPI0033FEB133
MSRAHDPRSDDPARPAPAGGRAADTGRPFEPRAAWLMLAVITMGTTMVSLDGTIVLLAQPALQADLNASLVQVQWVTAAYVLAVGALLIVSGGIGDRIGNRLTFLIGVTGFAVSSGLIAAAHDAGWLIGLRVLQGVSGAVLQPSTMGLLRESFPEDRLDMPIAVRSASIGISTAAGPVIGGLLVEHVSWRAAFLINIPLGLLTVALGAWVWRGRPARRPAPAARRSFDVPGALILGLLLCALFLDVSAIAARGVTDGRSVALTVATTVLAWLFVRRERRAVDPLVPPTLLASPPLWAGFVLVISLAFTMIGTLFVVSYYVQNHLGLHPVEGGVHVLPLTGTLIVAAPLSGIAMRKVGARAVVCAGLAVTAGAVYGLSRIGTQPGSTHLGLLLFALGLGLAPALAGSTKMIVSQVPVPLGGLAGGLHQTGMQIGSGIGIATMGTMLGSRAEDLLRTALRQAGADDADPRFVRQALDEVSVGLHQPLAHMPAGLRGTWEGLSRSIFMDAMSYALLAGVIATCVGLAVTAPSLLTELRDRKAR